MNSSLWSAVVVTMALNACAARHPAPAIVPAHEAEPGRLSASRFVAFGDTITGGFLHGCPGGEPPVSRLPEAPPASAGVRNIPPSGLSYPSRLQTLLRERFPGQPIDVINEGGGGGEIEASAAEFRRVLVGDAPDVLLLLEGVNSLNQRGSDGVAHVVDALRTRIREAKQRGVVVLVATILPQRRGGCRAYDLFDGIDDIVAANVQIRTLAGDEGAILVDLYEAFNGRTATLIGPDGLHPSAEGYAAIARTFFDAITRHLQE